jgi:FtsP/CotA-like multicopper oxidase with cupredoxin domain
VKRRNFLKLSTSVGLAPFLTSCHSDNATALTNTPPFDLEAHQPKRVESKNGELNYEMNIEYSNPVVNGQTLNVRTFNGKFPPDTLVMRPGDVMNIHFVNNLPASAEDHYHPEDINIPHGFNNANLHTHGMNVSPAGNEDNILLVIRPEEDFNYATHIPADHPAGTFWYHTHKHGSALHQFSSGMSGYILVEGGAGDLDKVPEIANAKTIDLAFHELIFDRTTGEVPATGDGEAAAGNNNPDPTLRNPLINLFQGTSKLQYTINGLAVDEGAVPNFQDPSKSIPGIPPVLRMRLGEVQRWRFGMLCHLQTYRFVLEGHKLNVASWDGITADLMESYDELVLGPANRVDFIIKASNTPGTYAFKMVKEKFGEHEIVPGFPLFVSPDAFSDELPVFNVIVEGDPLDMPLPASLNPPTTRLPAIAASEITRRRQIDFKVVGDVFFDPTTFAFKKDTRQYYINNVKFNAKRLNHTMLLGQTEEWTLTNNHIGINGHIPQINHPFHIHVNWFQVMEIHHPDGTIDLPNNGQGVWADTVDIPFGGKSIIRHRFEKFTGIFPFHCHVISHEDEGMMNLVEIIDPTPVIANITVDAGGILNSGDIGERVIATFDAGVFAADTDVTHHISLDPQHDISEGLVGLERYFQLESAMELSGGSATVVVKFPFELPLGATYDPTTVQLYRSTGSGWTMEEITKVSMTDDGIIQDGDVQLSVRVLTSTVDTLGDGHFAVMATQLSGPVTDAEVDILETA